MDALLVSTLFGAAGAVGAHVLTRLQMRREVEFSNDKELRAQRLAAYRDLWKRLEPLALYTPPAPVDMRTLQTLSCELRVWYYQVGGIFLTHAARDHYFTLQDALQLEISKTDREPLRPIDRIFTRVLGSKTEYKPAGDTSAQDERFLALFQCASRLRSQVASDLETRTKLIT